MSRIKRIYALLSCLAVLGSFMAAEPAHATFTMTLTPERGGRDIRFTPVKPGVETRNEELAVSVFSDEGKPYRIRIQQLSPFVNERGQTLSSDTVKIFSRSSVSGTLEVRVPQALNPGQFTLYTSD